MYYIHRKSILNLLYLWYILNILVNLYLNVQSAPYNRLLIVIETRVWKRAIIRIVALITVIWNERCSLDETTYSHWDSQ